MNDQYPRFRTAHDAGKYIAAQLYPSARGLNPEEFGAVPRYVENPEWQKANFKVVNYPAPFSGDVIYELVDRSAPDTRKLRTPQEWYQASPFNIIIAADKPDYQEFSEWWNYEQITKEEFADYLSGCTLID